MRKIFATISLLSMAPALVAQDPPPTDLALVQVHVTSRYDDEVLDNISLSLTSAYTKVEYRARKGSASISVPYGTYQLTVEASGFGTMRRELRVGQPSVWTYVSLAVSEEGIREPKHVNGLVVPPPRREEIEWVKLVPITGSGGQEALVDTGGRFKMEEVDRGPFLLVLLRGTKVLATRELLVSVSRDVVIQDTPHP